ncbi:MAG: ankyrin repeat domain-containing protein [Synergistaceae bacterium]|nr:ankyrin repeat domain-containing protein [Synergistaceae bacterium]
MSDSQFVFMCMFGEPEEIEKAIQDGANVNGVEDSTGWTGLHIAAYRNDNPEVLRLLLENGADIDAKDENGVTPLILAVSGRKPGNILLLLDRGADVGKAADYLPVFFPDETPSGVDEKEWKTAVARLKAEEYTPDSSREDEAGNLPGAETGYVLKAEDADLSEAPDVIVEGSPSNLGGWRVGNKVSFSVDLKNPGGYTVFLDYSKQEYDGDHANLKMTFKNEESGSSMSVGAPLPYTGDSWANYEYHEFSTLWPLEAGKTIISLESANPEGVGHVMNLRSVTIR